MASFLSRAQKALERGDEVRAFFVLINGLKRIPEDAEALDALLFWYGIKHQRGGLEHDIIAVLSLQPDAEDLMSVLADNLSANGSADIAGDLLAAGELVGMRYLPPEPTESAPPPIGLPDLDEDTVDGIPVPQSLLAEPNAPMVEPPAKEEEIIEEPPPQRPPEALEQQAASEAKSSRASRGVSGKRPRKRFVIAILVLGVLVAVGVYFGQQAQRSAELMRLDAELETMDPLNMEEIRDMAAAADARWESPEFAERLAFVLAVSPVRAEPPPESVAPNFSAWGYGTTCLLATQRGDLETGLQVLARMEREFPQTIPTSLCGAKLEESRGHFAASRRYYKELTEEFPKLVVGVLGLIRVSIRTQNGGALDEGLSALQDLNPEHPYLRLEAIGVLGPAGLLTGRLKDKPGTPIPEGLSPFLDTAAAYQKALQALYTNDIALMSTEAEVVIAMDDAFTPALLLVGLGRVAAYDPSRAMAAFDRLGQLDDLNPEFQVLAQSTVGLSLALSGRPDLALKYTSNAENSGLRPTWFARKSSNPPVEIRIMEAVVLNELGRSSEIQKVASAQGEELAFFEFLYDQPRGEPRAQSDEEKSVARISKEYEAGNHSRVVELALQLPRDSKFAPIVSRFVIQSLLAQREVGRALAELKSQNAPLIYEVFLEGLRLRALSRLGKGNEEYEQKLSQLTKAVPIGVSRTTDLALAAFWQGSRKQAQRWVEEALSRDPQHKRANWVQGIILRSRGMIKESAPFLARSGREVENNPHVLMELGYLNLELENFQEARKMFYRALLKDRQNMEAIAGLGRAMARVNSEVAIRELTRILENYSTDSEYAGQRAEVMKWVAVSSGSRKGVESAVVWLDDAEKLVGRRADLLLERARYHQAKRETSVARKLFAQALERNSTLAEAHLGLGKMALAEKDPKVARVSLEKYVELSPRGDDRAWAIGALDKL